MIVAGWILYGERVKVEVRLLEEQSWPTCRQSSNRIDVSSCASFCILLNGPLSRSPSMIMETPRTAVRDAHELQWDVSLRGSSHFCQRSFFEVVYWEFWTQPPGLESFGTMGL